MKRTYVETNVLHWDPHVKKGENYKKMEGGGRERQPSYYEIRYNTFFLYTNT